MLQPNEFTYVHNDHKGKMIHQCLAHDVNLRGIFLMFGGMVAITAVVVAIARVFPPESVDSSSSIEDSGGAVPFPRFSSSIN
jgi:hypothetical protein